MKKVNAYWKSKWKKQSEEKTGKAGGSFDTTTEMLKAQVESGITHKTNEGYTGVHNIRSWDC